MNLNDVTSYQNILMAGFSWGVNNTLQGSFIDSYEITAGSEDYSGSSEISEHKTSLGINFTQQIYDNPLTITLSNIVLKKIFGFENNSNLKNFGLIIFVCEFLRTQQKLGIPLLLKVSNFLGLVLLKDFNYNVSNGIYSNFHMQFQQFQVFLPTESSSTTGVAGSPVTSGWNRIAKG